MSALFLQGWPGITKLLDVFTRVVSVFASRDLLCRSPIIDPLRKARADPLRGRRGYRLAPRYMYRGQSTGFNCFSQFYVILCYQRTYVREWYEKKEWLFCFVINLTKQDLYTQFANPGFRSLSQKSNCFLPFSQDSCPSPSAEPDQSSSHINAPQNPTEIENPFNICILFKKI